MRLDGVLLGLVVLATALGGGVGVSAAQSRDDDAARTAFEQAYAVFTHPRCLNCHPVGDVPLQGDASRPHAYRVKRGADGGGVSAMRCTNCHQAANVPGRNTPPGAPHPAEARKPASEPRWHLPDPKVLLVFQDRTPAQLCGQLKDPKRNGGLTHEQLVHHVTVDPFVVWAWNPGDGRTAPSLSHDAFVAAVTTWLAKGGACPPGQPGSGEKRRRASTE